MAGSRLCKPNPALVRVWLLGWLMTSNTSSMASEDECIIVLHGLGRTSFAMRPLANALQADYKVVNQGYPSRKHRIETLADMAIKPALEQCPSASKIHFVTHSMGGILVRQFLASNRIEQLGHVVMLGPPNQGSELVDYLQSTTVNRWLFNNGNGPAGAQLGTDENSLPRRLGKVDFSLGVIAGNVSFSPLFSRTLKGEDDGKVSVEHSKVEGMSDHIVMPTSHTFMMRNTAVIAQTKHYLKHGRFARG